MSGVYATIPEGRSSFLKKRSKRLLICCRGSIRKSTRQEQRFFGSFFQKKNCFSYDSKTEIPPQMPLLSKGRVVTSAKWRKASMMAATFLPFAVLVGYYARRSEAPAVDAAAAPPRHDAANLDRLIDSLRDRLALEPADTEGWVLLGRSLVSQGQWTEARQAFAQASSLHPENPDLHAQLGEALTLEANGRVTPEAAAEFALAPDDPRAPLLRGPRTRPDRQCGTCKSAIVGAPGGGTPPAPAGAALYKTRSPISISRRSNGFRRRRQAWPPRPKHRSSHSRPTSDQTHMTPKSGWHWPTPTQNRATLRRHV